MNSESSEEPDSEAPDGYEPPSLTDLGSFAELTGQQLKVSGTADLVNFVSSS